MKRRLLIALLALVCATTCAFGLSGCPQTDSGDGGNSGNNTEQGGDENPDVGNTTPHSHVYGDWQIITPAACETDGEKKRECTCGDFETDIIPATGHNLVDGVCSVCGATESVGLEFELLSDNTYSVIGIGECEDVKIIIPAKHNSLPVTSVGKDAFEACKSFTSVTIPNSVNSIGKNAFASCYSLKSITIPEGVTSIGMGAFVACISLESITMPESVTSIGMAAFVSCYSIESIEVSNGNTVYHSAGNCLIETQSKTLLTGCKNSIIPDDGSVTSIGEYAFFDCRELTSISIPDGVTSIGNFAFSGCTLLASITIPGRVNSIGNDAFHDCSSITNITIPDGITSIGNDAFHDCSSITNITIPDGITSIGDYTFRGCSSLISITIPDSVTAIGYNALSSCRSLTSINFKGTKAQWNAIEKGTDWINPDSYTIHCTDGDIEYTERAGTYKFDSMKITLNGTVTTIKAGQEYLGITYGANYFTLELNSDNTFELTENNTKSEGTWEEKNGIIILYAQDIDGAGFTVEGTKLVYEVTEDDISIQLVLVRK